MSCRHLNIKFYENGDVEYNFFKHHSDYKLYKYQIDYPIEQIEIIGGQDYNSDNFKMTKMSNGFALLTWDKLKEDKHGARGITYKKKNFLKKIEQSDGTFTLKYFEKINIKASLQEDRFGLCLHSKFSNISAIKNKSTAIFNGVTYKPRNLCEIVFDESGILEVDWELEIQKNK